jgi:hypothetical protein
VAHLASVSFTSALLPQGPPVLSWTGIDATAPSECQRALVRDLEALMASLYRGRAMALYGKVGD